MRSRYWLSVAVAAFVLTSPVSADELKTPAAPEASASRPARGMSMEKVEASFGAPTRRVAPVGGSSVGQPPITRWEYPGFVVYFENDKVIHSVAIG